MTATTPPRRPTFWLMSACALSAAFLALLPAAPNGVPAALAQADLSAEELEQNRQLLERWKKEDPDHYARLRQDARDFLQLPAERQHKLRQLDHDLHEEGSSAAHRLIRVLERYVDWLEHLPAGERQQLEQAPDSTQRLALIKKMREDEWVRRLPLAWQDEIKQATGAARTRVIARLRQEERERRAVWRVAVRHWDDLVQKRPQPARLDDFPPNVQTFVRDMLFPQLSKEERDRLDKAEGEWPRYPRTLVELVDRHPIKLPGPPTGPSRFTELPADVQNLLPNLFKKKPTDKIKAAEGKWPDYAIAVTEWFSTQGRKKKLTLPRQLGPSKPSEFAPPLRNFIDKRLYPQLTREEQDRLVGTQGQWPQYPQLVLALAKKYRLEVPGMALPGGRNWERFRTSARLSPDDGLRSLGKTATTDD